MGLGSWQELLLHPVCAHHIHPYLSPVDLMSLKRAVKGVDVDIFQLCIDRLRMWLSRRAFPEMLSTFIVDQLCNTRGFLHLTGSLAVLLMTGDAWEVGDVDLICTRPYAQLDNGMYHIYNLTWREPMGYRQVVKESPLYKSSSALIHVTTRFVGCNGYKVQFLEVDPLAVDTYINSFDLSFCKIIIGQGKLRVFEPHDLLRRTMDRPLPLYDTYFPRTISEPAHLFHNYLPQRYFRLRKYVLRGFNFTLDITVDRTPEDIQPNKRTNLFNMGMITAYWHMFWAFCVNRNGKIMVDAIPQWK